MHLNPGQLQRRRATDIDIAAIFLLTNAYKGL